VIGSVSKLSVGVQTDGTYKGRLSLSLSRSGRDGSRDGGTSEGKGVGEGEGEGEGCFQRAVPPGGLEPLIFRLRARLRRTR
jgi:hypothetical protein